MMDVLSLLPVVAPLLAALLLPLIGAEERTAQRGVALLGALVALLTTGLAWQAFDASQPGYQFETHLPGLERFGLALRLGFDGKALPLLLMSGVVGLGALLAADPKIERPREHYALLLVGLAAWGDLLFVLGMVNVLYAAWVAMQQTDWNRLIAYASISHAGYTFIALSAGSELAQASAVVLMFGHGLVTSLGFLLTDELAWATGQSRIDKLGGLARSLPVLSLAFSVFAIAGAGFPGSATFVAELMVFFAAWGAELPLAQAAAVVCVFGVILSATYLFRALHATFFGEPPATLSLSPNAERFRALPLVATLLLVASSTAVGVWPRLITDLIAPPSTELAAHGMATPHAPVAELTEAAQ